MSRDLPQRRASTVAWWEMGGEWVGVWRGGGGTARPPPRAGLPLVVWWPCAAVKPLSTNILNLEA